MCFRGLSAWGLLEPHQHVQLHTTWSARPGEGQPGTVMRPSARDLENNQVRHFFAFQLHGEALFRQFRGGLQRRRLGAILEANAVDALGIQPFGQRLTSL